MPSLRVATANAASGRDRATGAPSLSTWAAAAAGLDADVLAVQELDHLLPRSGSVDQLAEIADAVGAVDHRFAAAVEGTPGSRETFTAAAATRAGVASYGVGMVTRLPVRRWTELRMAPSRLSLPVALPPAAPQRFLWAPDEQRVALAAVVAAPGGDVTVVCTHLSFAPTRAPGQLRELRRWARGLPRPLLLVGDLNLPGPVPARLTGWTPLARHGTYPAPDGRVQLDHVLLDDPDGVLRVTSTAAREVAGSDHLALVVDLAR